MKAHLARVETLIDYGFRNKDLLEEALTHPSASREGLASRHYERLEFLGDAILGMVVARLLFDLFPDEREGALAKRKATLVSGVTLAKIARGIGLADAVILSPSEEAAGGRENGATLENACEAIIGAIYLDGGYAEAKRFVLTHWTELARELKVPPKDAKTRLQEWVQARGYALPLYEVLTAEGPDHAPVFTCLVQVEGLEPTQGQGLVKRMAEQEAAAAMLEQIQARYEERKRR